MRIIATSLSLLLPVLYWMRNGSLSKVSGALSGKYGVVDGRQPVNTSGQGSNVSTGKSLTDLAVGSGSAGGLTPQSPVTSTTPNSLLPGDGLGGEVIAGA